MSGSLPAPAAPAQTATQQVTAVLRAGTQPAELQALFLSIFQGEVGDQAPNGPVTDPWRVEYGYTYWTGSLDTFPDWGGVLLENGLYTTAFGAAQITKTTHADWVKLPSAPTDMNPPSQVAIALLGAASRYATKTSRDLLTDLRSSLLGEIQLALAGTWPGGMNGFATRYPANLAALQAAPPPPPPTDTVLFSGSDATGRPIQILLRQGSAAMNAAMMVGAVIAAGLMHGNPPLTSPPAAATQPGFDWLSPIATTFAFDESLRPVPLSPSRRVQ